MGITEGQTFGGDASDSVQVIGPPAYASPDPSTNAGRLVAIEEHPLRDQLDPDYGANERRALETHAVGDTSTVASTDEDAQYAALDQGSRDNWTAEDWKTAARYFGLTLGGNKQDLRNRVEDYETKIADAKEFDADDWGDLIGSAESAEELQGVRNVYKHSGASVEGVEEAFQGREAELTTNG